MQNSRNADVLRHIISYCNDIVETIERFGEDYEVFAKDSVYRNATALCVLQIGELTSNLTDDFKKTYAGMPWTQIKALRNVIAHSYGKIDVESLWETITGDIPKLKTYCSSIIQKFDVLMQESITKAEDEQEIKDISID
ncbi:HepT-like ribonuclease domain-containing protein [Desulfoscipio sp. XC116]|uniref:HepT-like ribonuclease domain-containing protein n=1 Tax=Desulfoscipio sp. XC116 TaxID=3144975 RepID=UPI00325A4695